MSECGRIFSRGWIVEPILPLVFAVCSALVLRSSSAPDWQWVFLALIACMSIVGSGERMRMQLVAWRYLTLTFAVVVFLILNAGLHSPFILGLYAIAVIYPRYIQRISVVATTTAIAAGCGFAEWWTQGWTPSLLHIPGIFLVGYVARRMTRATNAFADTDSDSVCVLRLRADDEMGPTTSAILNLWRESIVDYLGEDVVVLTTAQRQLAVLLPEQSPSQTELIAESLRYRFAALALPPVVIERDSIRSETPSTHRPLTPVS